MSNGACVSSDPRPWWLRLIHNRFPRTPLAIPEDDIPGYAPSYMMVTTEAHLDWKDRLRILVSGKCRVDTRIYTDVTVNRSQSESCFMVLPP